MVHTERGSRDQAITIRVNRQQRDLIDRAATAQGKTRSEFMLESASREAESILLDRVFFQLDDEVSAAFATLLDTPPPASDELRALLSTKPPWE